MDEAAILQDLRAILGDRGVVADAAGMQPHLEDWTGRFHGRALAVARPASTEEVVAVVALAREHGLGLVPQGGRTSLAAGATPSLDGETPTNGFHPLWALLLLPLGLLPDGAATGWLRRSGGRLSVHPKTLGG